MIPVEIKPSIKTMDDVKLRSKINFLSYTFCVNADFSKTEAIAKLVDELEMYTLEGLLRVLDDEVGFRPYQNKVYEQVERKFEDQDAYNINRMLSSIRRTKMIPIDPDNAKYIKWMKNRVKYGTKTIIENLNEVDFDKFEPDLNYTEARN